MANGISHSCFFLTKSKLYMYTYTHTHTHTHIHTNTHTHTHTHIHIHTNEVRDKSAKPRSELPETNSQDQKNHIGPALLPSCPPKTVTWDP